MAWGFCFLYLTFDSSVCWCLIRWIWVACISPATCLICLAYFFASWYTLLAGNLSRSTVPSFIALDTNSSSCRKNQNMSLCKIFAVSGGYFARSIWAFTQLYYSSTLLTPGGSLLTSQTWLAPHWIGACRTLQTRTRLYPILTHLLSSPMTHWSIPKSPLQAITFLHCWGSGRAASSHSTMFSHFNFHFKKQCYKLSLTVQSILGPSMYGLNVLCIAGLGACGLLGWNEISPSDSLSELALSSWVLGISTSWSGIAKFEL